MTTTITIAALLIAALALVVVTLRKRHGELFANTSDREAIIRQKMAAGLTRAQAEIVITNQEEHDAALAAGNAPPNLPAASTTEPASDKAVDDMTVAELKDYAAAHNVDLTGLTLKDDILAAVKKAAA